MRWSPNNVAYWARRAGFDGEDLVDAVAIALATSQGDDGYWFEAGVGSLIALRGLFAIDVAAHPELAGVDLADPATNADALYALAAAQDGSLAWHPTVGTAAYLQALYGAQTAVSEPYEPDVAPADADDGPVSDAGNAAAVTVGAMRRTLTEVGRALRSLHQR